LVSNLTKSLTFFTVYFITVYCKQSRTHLKEKAVIKGWPVSWAETIVMASYETSRASCGGRRHDETNTAVPFGSKKRGVGIQLVSNDTNYAGDRPDGPIWSKGLQPEMKLRRWRPRRLYSVQRSHGWRRKSVGRTREAWFTRQRCRSRKR
jgi:hypothetical protein